MRNVFLPLVSFLALGACAADSTEEDPLGDVLDDGKQDSVNSPTNHNDYFFGTRADVEIKGSQRYHAWQFQLGAKADLILEAYATDQLSENHTRLYVYKKSSGSTWRLVDSTDNADGEDAALYPRLEKGTYRVIVKGRTSRTKQRASFSASCSGEGCPRVGEGCAFGQGGLGKLPDSYITLEGDPIALTPGDFLDDTGPEGSENSTGPRLMEAYAAATGTVPASISEVFAGVKDGKITTRGAQDHGPQSYDLYEFTVRGKKVAAFFGAGSQDDSTAAIMVGSSMASCAVAAPVCAFGPSFGDMDQWMTQGDSKDVRYTRALDDLEARQALAAARNAPGHLAMHDASDIFERWQQVSFSNFTDEQTGKSYTRVTFAEVGQTSHRFSHSGLIFEEGSEAPVAQIWEDEISHCLPTHPGQGPVF